MRLIRWGPGNAHGWRRLCIRWLVVLLVLTGGVVYVIAMPGHSYRGPFPALSPEERDLGERLEAHVRYLASAIGERNVWHAKELEAAAHYIQEQLQRFGYRVGYHAVAWDGRLAQNLEAELRGTARQSEILVLGAHYDSVLGCPGANDNASGVAALLEIARIMRPKRLVRTVRFVAFVNEEPPFFRTDAMGSLKYAKRARAQQENIVGMLSLETIGYYSDEPNSQRYPFPFRFFYPDRGDFIGFVSNLSSRRLVRNALGVFRDTTRFPSEGVAAPGWITGVGWSDHASFWQVGFPAIMVTDTAPFRYRHYHAPTDTPDKLDYDRLARVVAGLSRVVGELANTPTEL